MTSLKAIVVGAGYFSRFQYEAWTRIPEVRIVAAVNRTVDKLHPFKDTYAIPRIASLDKLEAVIDEEHPDFIDLVTPPESHLDIVRLAARKGVHVICQKPLAPTMEEAREVVDTANRAGIRFLVHENWRWQPWYRKMRALLDEGAIGSLHSIAVRMRMGDGWQEDAYLARQPFFRKYPRLLIYETGVHFLDTFRYLGGEINTIYARLQKRNPDIAGEDAGQVFAGFRSGATAILDASRYNETDAEDPRYTFGTVRIDGSNGHMELGTDGGITLKGLGEPSLKIDYKHEKINFAGDCVYYLQRHFVDCMLNAKPFESTGEDYLKTVALVEACYRSHESNKVIQVS